MDGAHIPNLDRADPDGPLRRLLGGPQAQALQAAIGRHPWRGRIDGPAARALFDWPRLNAALAEHRFDRSRLYLSGPKLSGQDRHALRDATGRVDAQRLNRALRDGATLILNAAHEASPQLAALCQALAADYLCLCQANLYACWRDATGFDVHWDDHDVIVVQAEGRKRWALYGATREAPLIHGDPPDHRPPPEPQETFELQAGDVLYLPRGVWHAAAGVGEPSLHLTIGLTRRTGADFLRWLADRLTAEAVVRRDLPFEHGDAALADHMAQVLAAATAQDLPSLAADYRRHLEAAFQAPPALSFPALGGPETAPSPHDRIVLAPGPARLEPAPTPEGAPGAVILTWRGDRFTVSSSLDAILRRLTAGEPAPLEDFTRAASADDALAFVRAMIARGVFQLSPAPEA